jgi:hypothetical protein
MLFQKINLLFSHKEHWSTISHKRTTVPLFFYCIIEVWYETYLHNWSMIWNLSVWYMKIRSLQDRCWKDASAWLLPWQRDMYSVRCIGCICIFPYLKGFLCICTLYICPFGPCNTACWPFINGNKSNNIGCSAVESLKTKKLCNLSLLRQRTPAISSFFKVITGLVVVQKKHKLAFDNVKH